MLDAGAIVVHRGNLSLTAELAITMVQRRGWHVSNRKGANETICAKGSAGAIVPCGMIGHVVYIAAPARRVLVQWEVR